MNRKALLPLVVLALATAASAQKVTTSRVTGSLKGKWKTTILMPRVSGSGALASFANQQFKNDTKAMTTSFMKQVKESLSGGFELPGPLELDVQPTFTVVSPKWVCGYWTVYSYLGGAHGATGFTSFNYTIVGGKPRNIGLSDLFANAGTAADDLTKVLTQKLLANPNALFIKDGTSSVDAKELPFAMTKKGMLFLIEPYLAGPYSEGTFKVPIGYGETMSKFKLRAN